MTYLTLLGKALYFAVCHKPKLPEHQSRLCSPHPFGLRNTVILLGRIALVRDDNEQLPREKKRGMVEARQENGRGQDEKSWPLFFSLAREAGRVADD